MSSVTRPAAEGYLPGARRPVEGLRRLPRSRLQERVRPCGQALPRTVQPASSQTDPRVAPVQASGVNRPDVVQRAAGDVVDLTPDDAGQAFLLKEVDAAVTFEPWLTQGKEAAHGHLLADSSAKPGLLVDCLMTTPGVLEKRQAEFNALGRAWEGRREVCRRQS